MAASAQTQSVDVPALAVLLDEAAKRHGIDPAIARAVAKVESGGKDNAVSPKGAVGPMQLMPGTARDMGLIVDHTVDERFDRKKNVDAGVKYLKKMFDLAIAHQASDPNAYALAAYNGGPGRMDRVGGDISAMPAETRNYVPSVYNEAGMNGTDIGGDFTVGGGDTGVPQTDIAPAPAKSTPAQTDAAPEPTAVDKMLDAMLPKLAERIAQPEPPPVPPKGFPLGFRIAAGTIAAMDPDAYQKIVGPALAGKQMEIEQYHRDVAGQKDDTQRAFMTLMGLAQRRDQQKELEANRSARLNIQEEVNRMRGEMNEARIGELEANRKQKEVDQKVAAEHVANISDRMSTIFPGIQQFAQTSAPDDPSGMVLMSEASALQNTLGEMAQSKEPVNPDAARQLQQEYNSIAQNFMMAALERKRLADQRAKSDATMAAGVAKRERIPAADGRQATNEANIIVGFADTLKYLNQNGPKIGNIKFSDFQRGPLGNEFRDTARAMYSTNIMAPRKEYFGAAYTATEGISGKWTFAQDINSMFIGELRTGLETLITMSARKHLDLLHGLEADGYDVEGRFDRYAKEIRPALKSVHAGFLDVPPGVPLGTQTMSLSTGGDLFIRLPGEKENRPWIPEDEMDYKWLARLMKWEGHRAGRIEENLSRLGAEPSAIAAIMSDIHMGGSSGQNR